MSFSETLANIRARTRKYRANTDLYTPPIKDTRGDMSRPISAAARAARTELYSPPVLRAGKTDLAPAPGALEKPKEYLAEPAKKEPSGWGARLGKGLSAAAYAMQANVGRPMAGQEWKQGILRGIAGIGAWKAGEAAAAEKKAERAESLADKLTYLKAEQAGKVTGPSWGEKFKQTEAGKMERLEKSLGAISQRVEDKRQADISSGKTPAAVERWERSWKEAFASFGEYEKYKPGYDQMVSDRAQKFNDIHTLQETGIKPKPPKPLKAPPLPEE